MGADDLAAAAIDEREQMTSDLQKPCQAPETKIFRFIRREISGTYLAIPSRSEGRWPSSLARGGDAVDADVAT
ncbi:MAG: hypothetical protein ACREEK_35625, partial [Bradyrhizobium sp.]